MNHPPVEPLIPMWLDHFARYSMTWPILALWVVAVIGVAAIVYVRKRRVKVCAKAIGTPQ